MDVAVIWPKAYVQFHICYRPTAELAHFASLGIPTVVYPFASYLDVLVDFGYPLVAENLADVREPTSQHATRTLAVLTPSSLSCNAASMT